MIRDTGRRFESPGEEEAAAQEAYEARIAASETAGPRTPEGRALSRWLRTHVNREVLDESIRTTERQAVTLALTAAIDAINEHADIRLPDGRLAIAREHAIEVLRGALIDKAVPR